GKLAAELMNSMGYDAMAVGNHEFDDGPQVLRTFMDAVNFPVLMANADVSQEPHLAESVEKSIILERHGEKLGVIGLVPQDTAEGSKPGDNVVFTNPADAVQTQVNLLAEQGIDKIIVLSHSGYGIDLALAEQTTGVDVIVGGHSHTYLSSDDPSSSGPYPTMVGDTAIVQAFAYGKYLGRLEVVFNEAGKVTSASGAPILMDASVAEAEDVKARITEAAVPLEEVRSKVVAEAAEEINGNRAVCRSRECPMGTLVADALLARTAGQGVEIALTNGGGLRASIDAGPVTMGEVFTVLPFQNTLSTFRVSGATLLEALENGVGQITDGAGRFPQVAGMSFTVNPLAPVGERIADAMIGDTPLEPDRMYTVVSNNFLRNGGDGYAMFEDAEDAYDFGPDIADVVAEYLAQQTPYTPYTDGRIKMAPR
ncbi:MAG: 5'-nucleotidase C-terminal domain-containing protein, partial [Pseudomonadota bacterium]